MAKNFMPELDPVRPLTKLLTDKAHLDSLAVVAPNEDYSEWAGHNTKIRLCNVKWNADSHVVNWESEQVRDAWFGSLPVGTYLDIETGWNIFGFETFKPYLNRFEGSVILPVTFEQALGFNYMMVDRYIQPTSQDQSAPQRERYFFFITGITNDIKAPNTTVFALGMDSWTEYYPQGVGSVSVDLERGHYPVTQITTTEYLANPLTATVNLTAPEPDLGSVKTLQSFEQYTPIYGKTPVVMFGSTANLASLGDLWADGQTHTVTPYWWLNLPNVPHPDTTDPTTARPYTWNNSDWGGQQLPPSGGSPSDGTVTYPNTVNIQTQVYTTAGPAVTPGNGTTEFPLIASPSATQPPPNGENQPGVYTFACASSDFVPLMDYIRGNLPQIIPTIKFTAVVPAEFITQANPFQIGTYTVQQVQSQSSIQQLAHLGITPQMFGWKQDWTKLYTGQFCELEISDLQGNIATLTVQEVAGAIDIYARASTVFPWLKFEAFLNGVGGNSINNYTVGPIVTGETATAYMPVSDWERFHYEWDIPTYAIYADGKTLSYDLQPEIYADLLHATREATQFLNEAYKDWANGYNELESRVDKVVARAETDLAIADNTADTEKSNATNTATTEMNNLVGDVPPYSTSGMFGTLNSNRNNTIGTIYNNAVTEYTMLYGADGNPGVEANENNHLHEVAVREYNTENANATDRNKGLNSANLATYAMVKQIEQNNFDIYLNDTNLQKTLNGDLYGAQNNYDWKMTNLDIAFQEIFLGLQETLGAATSVLNGGMASTEMTTRTTSNSFSGTSGSGSTGTGSPSSWSSGITTTTKQIQPTFIGNANNNELGIPMSTALWGAQGLYNSALLIGQVNYQKDSTIAGVGVESSTGDSPGGYAGDIMSAHNSMIESSQQYHQQVIYTDPTGNINTRYNTDTTNENAYRYDVETNVIQRNLDMADENEGDAGGTGRYEARIQQIAMHFAAAASIASATQATDLNNQKQLWTQQQSNTIRTYDTEITNIGNTWTRAYDNATVEYNMRLATDFRLEYLAGITSLNNSLTVAKSVQNIIFTNAETAAQAKLYRAYQGDIRQFGENTGNGAAQDWARRGVDVRARRISVADEMSASRAFHRYGYRMPENTWVPLPVDLTLGRDFCYWKARDTWITTTEASESARNILRDIISNGVTVWPDPDTVLGVDLNA